MKANDLQADLGERNRGVGQQIVGDDGAPVDQLSPVAGGPGTGAGAAADLPTEHERSRAEEPVGKTLPDAV